MQQLPEDILRDNAVIIHAWFGESDGGYNVGHTSMHILKSNEYISAWPDTTGFTKTDENKAITGNTWPIKFHDNHNAAIADESKGDPTGKMHLPNFSCCLYTLDTQAMTKAYEEMKKEKLCWCLYHNKFSIFKSVYDEKAISCSGLTRELLRIGDISKLAWEGLTVSLAPSPHNVFTIVRNAKINELKLYPRTQDYDKQLEIPFNPHDHILTPAFLQESSYRLKQLIQYFRQPTIVKDETSVNLSDEKTFNLEGYPSYK